jgi:hypothetical protein
MTKPSLMLLPLKGIIAMTLFAMVSCNKQRINVEEPQSKASQSKKAQIRAAPAPYEIARWSGFRTAAVSYTFDDNCSNQVAIAVPALNTYGFKGTFFLVSGWPANWAGYKSAASNGHEIASHTVTHKSMGGLTTDQQTSEMTGSINTITSNIGIKPVTLAWPNCSLGSTSLAQQYFVASRGCSGQIVPSTPTNFMNISSLVCGSAGGVKTSTDFQNKANSAASSNGWVIYLIHGIDNDGGYSPLSSTELKSSLSFFNANSNKFWVAGFATVAKYIKQRNAANLTQTGSTSTNITLTLSDILDSSVYNVPITIRRPLPSGWTNASATQNGHAITCYISSGYIVFSAIADRGTIVLTKR